MSEGSCHRLMDFSSLLDFRINAFTLHDRLKSEILCNLTLYFPETRRYTRTEKESCGRFNPYSPDHRPMLRKVAEEL
jgi:hypothetical protein